MVIESSRQTRCEYMRLFKVMASPANRLLLEANGLCRRERSAHARVATPTACDTVLFDTIREIHYTVHSSSDPTNSSTPTRPTRHATRRVTKNQHPLLRVRTTSLPTSPHLFASHTSYAPLRFFFFVFFVALSRIVPDCFLSASRSTTSSSRSSSNSSSLGASSAASKSLTR